MQKLAGIAGGSINFTETFFGLVRNLNMAGDIGDTTVGTSRPTTQTKQPPLAVHLPAEAARRPPRHRGRAHPSGRYYALPPCNSINSCFQDLLYFNAGWTSPLYGVWGANFAYKTSPTTYVQAGAFSVNPAPTCSPATIGATSASRGRWPWSRSAASPTTRRRPIRPGLAHRLLQLRRPRRQLQDRLRHREGAQPRRAGPAEGRHLRGRADGHADPVGGPMAAARSTCIRRRSRSTPGPATPSTRRSRSASTASPACCCRARTRAAPRTYGIKINWQRL